jgi:tetratricopeptide (TPR) repeat protein
MLVLPEEENVRLVYATTGVDMVGRALTFVGLLVAALGGYSRWRGRRSPIGTKLLDSLFAYRWAWGPGIAMGLALVAVVVRFAWIDPWDPHRQGLELFYSGQYEAAEPLFSQSEAMAPSSAAAYYSDYYLCLCAVREMDWQVALTRLNGFIRDYPDGELVPEAQFRIAEAHQGLGRIDAAAAQFQLVIDEFPSTQWADFAAERLQAIHENGFDSRASGQGEPSGVHESPPRTQSRATSS